MLIYGYIYMDIYEYIYGTHWKHSFRQWNWGVHHEIWASARMLEHQPARWAAPSSSIQPSHQHPCQRALRCDFPLLPWMATCGVTAHSCIRISCRWSCRLSVLSAVLSVVDCLRSCTFALLTQSVTHIWCAKFWDAPDAPGPRLGLWSWRRPTLPTSASSPSRPGPSQLAELFASDNNRPGAPGSGHGHRAVFTRRMSLMLLGVGNESA